MLTLVSLKYALALKKEKHFGRAAEKSFVSQPSLSTAILKLEETLGLALFERHRKTVTVTQEGEVLLNQAEKILNELALLESMAKSYKTGLEMPLRLGAIYTVGPYLFPPLVKALMDKSSNFPLILEEGYTDKIREKLDAGSLDAAFVALPFEHPGILVSPVYEEAFVIVMRADHVLNHKKTGLTEEALINQEVLLLEAGNCFRDQVIQSCPKCFQAGPKQNLIEGASLETLLYMVASGFGITVLPSSATKNISLYDGLLVVKNFKSNPPKRVIGLAWRASFPRPKVMSLIIESLSKANIKNICVL